MRGCLWHDTQILVALIFGTTASTYLFLSSGDLSSIILVSPVIGQAASRPFLWTRLAEWSTTVPLIILLLEKAGSQIVGDHLSASTRRKNREAQARGVALRMWATLWIFFVAILPMMDSRKAWPVPRWWIAALLALDYAIFADAMYWLHDFFLALHAGFQEHSGPSRNLQNVESLYSVFCSLLALYPLVFTAGCCAIIDSSTEDLIYCGNKLKF
jgi:hypothetical protein